MNKKYINLKGSNFSYDDETKFVLKNTSKSNIDNVFSYEYCELDFSFVGFLHCYKDLEEKIPKDFTIIDIGGSYAFQGYYFRNHKNYIVVEPSVPANNIVQRENTIVYNMSGQIFIDKVMPILNLDLNKTFCVSSYVPDDSLRTKIIPESFLYYRTVYASNYDNLDEVIEELPIL